MALHIFQSVTTPEVYSFTLDVKGKNLPEDLGPWVNADRSIPVGIDNPSAKIGSNIARCGYAIISMQN